MEMTETVSLSSFDPTLVGLSFLISVFGSWCGLSCALRSRQRTGSASLLWLAGAALAIGGGAIWSMHFVGMLAYQGHIVYALNIPFTLLSLVVAVAAALVGMGIATRRRTLVGYLTGGAVTGGGVAMMHYLGMAAMRMNGSVTYDPLIVAVSVVIAVAAATLALWFAFTLTRGWALAGASLVMGLGVCTMHYTGMLAMTMEPSTHLSTQHAGVTPYSLALPIFGISALLLLFLFIAVFLDDEAPVASEA